MLFEHFKIVVFQKYATFSGRARRSEFWYYVLGCVIISFILNVIETFIGTKTMYGGFGFLGLIFNVLVLIPGLAVSFRRFHDLNKSGWYNVVLYLPYLLLVIDFRKLNVPTFELRLTILIGMLAYFVYVIYIIVLCAKEGTKGPNKYGPDPKNREFSVEDHLID